MQRKPRKAEPVSLDRQIVISRDVKAPRRLVWRAMTDPKHVVNWWGPRGFTSKVSEMDLRPDGAWNHVMTGPDGTEYPNRSVFLEIEEPARVVFSTGGGLKGGTHVQFVSTWTFDALAAAKTRVTIRMVFPTAAERDKVVREYGAIEGGKQTLERLEEYLPVVAAAPDLVLTRVFAAPCELVFKAWTEPALLKKWWGPKGFTNPVCEWDSRTGGRILVHMRAPNGMVYPMGGSVREIVPPKRLVFTAGKMETKSKLQFEILNTVTFAKRGNKTVVRLEARILSAAAGPETESAFAGMKTGWSQSLDRLERLIAKVQKNRQGSS